MEHLLAGVEAIPSSLWNAVEWITFFFKLISLAFVVPIVGLILFDFCVWLWRVYRPSSPADSSRASLLPDYVQSPPPTPTIASTTAIEPEPVSRAAERRVKHI
ncbi:hypothetical protein GGS21DRAFT_138762 [Xylaria nigripes]|nr:hypothetical protein GGS21DRAFT_138762 [Xylaria nigripes]